MVAEVFPFNVMDQTTNQACHLYSRTISMANNNKTEDETELRSKTNVHMVHVETLLCYRTRKDEA